MDAIDTHDDFSDASLFSSTSNLNCQELHSTSCTQIGVRDCVCLCVFVYVYVCLSNQSSTEKFLVLLETKMWILVLC